MTANRHDIEQNIKNRIRELDEYTVLDKTDMDDPDFRVALYTVLISTLCRNSTHDRPYFLCVDGAIRDWYLQHIMHESTNVIEQNALNSMLKKDEPLDNNMSYTRLCETINYLMSAKADIEKYFGEISKLPKKG